MSAVSQIQAHAANALAAGHDDDLLLMPVNVLVSGRVDQVKDSGKGIPQLHITEELPTHVVSIRRWKLAAADVDPKLVASIRFEGKTYRVQNFTNDAAIPELEFLCRLS